MAKAEDSRLLLPPGDGCGNTLISEYVYCGWDLLVQYWSADDLNRSIVYLGAVTVCYDTHVETSAVIRFLAEKGGGGTTTYIDVFVGHKSLI